MSGLGAAANAEHALIAGLLDGRFALQDVACLAPEDLSSPRCRQLLEALRRLPAEAWLDGTPDLAVLADLARLPAAEVCQVLDALPLAQSPAGVYIVEVRKLATWRRVRGLATKVHGLAEPDPEVLSALRAALEAENGVGQAGRLPLVSARELVAQAAEEAEWLVDGLIREGSLALLTGATGAGKTVLAQALAVGVAEGGEFLGRCCTAHPVVLVNADGGDNVLAERFRLLGTPADLHIWKIADDPPKLATGVYERLVRPGEMVLIIFDCLRRFHGDDESDSTAMAPVMRSLRRLTNIGATVLVLHHTGKDGDYRGSEEILAAVDQAWRLRRGHGGRLEIVTLKDRFGPPGSKLAFRPEWTKMAIRFVDLSPEVADRHQSEEEWKLLSLADVIKAARGAKGGAPNQSDIVKRAEAEFGLGRKAVLQLLAAGESKFWVSESKGKERTYRLRKGSPR